jgi:hypothetical protein
VALFLEKSKMAYVMNETITIQNTYYYVTRYSITIIEVIMLGLFDTMVAWLVVVGETFCFDPDDGCVIGNETGFGWGILRTGIIGICDGVDTGCIIVAFVVGVDIGLGTDGVGTNTGDDGSMFVEFNKLQSVEEQSRNDNIEE